MPVLIRVSAYIPHLNSVEDQIINASKILKVRSVKRQGVEEELSMIYFTTGDKLEIKETMENLCIRIAILTASHEKVI